MKIYQQIYLSIERIYHANKKETFKDLKNLERLILSLFPEDLRNDIVSLEVFSDGCVVEEQIDHKKYKQSRIEILIVYKYINRFMDEKFHAFTFTVIPSFKDVIFVYSSKGWDVKAKPVKKKIAECLKSILLSELG